MRTLVLNADYPRFLAWLYGRHPGLQTAGYAEQMVARNESLFGVADFYSRNLRALGHQAADVHVNNLWLQSAWAREHGMAFDTEANLSASRKQRLPGWLQRTMAPLKPALRPLGRRLGLSPRLSEQAERVLLAQIAHFKPDLVLNQDVFYVSTRLVRRIRDLGVRLIIGQVGIEPSKGEDWNTYDLMLSQLPRVVRAFRAAGVRAEVCHLAFEPAVLDALPARPAPDIDVSFVGSVSEDHRERIALLEFVAERHDLKLWGNIPNSLPSTSRLRRCFQGEVWGSEMYDVLRRSRISLNSHIDIAGDEAGNMRLFEATGVGSFLLTDFKQNLHTLFEADRDVVVWRSPEDCSAAIERYLGDDAERRAVAAAGQQTTLARHNFRARVQEILNLIA
ncbi:MULTISPECIES: glycosyltransferase [unclassified Bradyrhizobium]|uniref:CgeB family protein n=1 Tax=unclassified Bradyrhizobium TaxID=2631580 RepID=UPI001FF7A4C7|nr:MULTISPECIES: glycosyltransferase [unclassified Bradyrhizobium]MCK1432206.1 glycosyltransferase [Bradyrhizobium sp. 87]MCK1589228.1 glycosyltransferase [Bradyrhizobium sp. 169]